MNFDPAFPGTFQLWTPSHIVVMLLLATTWLVVPLWLRRAHDERLSTRVCTVLAVILPASIVAWTGWELLVGRATWQTSLPLNLCDLSTILCTVVLVTRSAKLFELVYFWTIAGALQSFVTPNIIYGFPHIEFYAFYLQHGAEILAVLVLCTSCGLRPRPRSILIAIGAIVLYLVPVYLVNMALDANYMFLMADTPHETTVSKMIRLFGQPPRHIIGLGMVASVSVVVLYLPWAIADWRRGRSIRAA